MTPSEEVDDKENSESTSLELDTRDHANHSKWSLSKFLTTFVGAAVLLLGLSWLLLDEKLSTQITGWLASPNLQPLTYSVLAIALLASDLILPVPSSAVITHAGIFLGALAGTLVGFVGMTLGSLIGFGTVKLLGTRWIEKKVGSKDLADLRVLTERYGVFIVVILRTVPILAEASVLVLAAGQMPFKPFLLWLSISNLFVAIFFSVFGQWAKENEIGELPALLIGIAIPILLLFAFRLLISRFQQSAS